MPRARSITIEGELVRKQWDFEYDYFSIDGKDLADVIEETLEEGTLEETGPHQREFRWGRVRLTLEEVR